VFAGDHGVTAEGVSAYPSIVTGEMVKNFAAGGAAICVLARAIAARLEVVDVGVLGPLPELPIVQAKVAAGTANLAVEAAMTAEQCAAALEVGRAAARRAVEQGANLLIAGDMGIGNTTPSAALICRLAGYSVDSIVGRGTGIDDAGLVNKRRAVQQALDRLQGQQLDGNAVLAELGGLEIAAMAGFYLEGAALGVPSLVDGFIASAAALAARAIDPAVADWLLASHCSEETGHKLALEALQLTRWWHWACGWAKALVPPPACPCCNWPSSCTPKWPRLPRPASPKRLRHEPLYAHPAAPRRDRPRWPADRPHRPAAE
jgi:nicotinate-nucleotide--dimethylbenzimidazole phosphoribosyltransferase